MDATVPIGLPDEFERARDEFGKWSAEQCRKWDLSHTVTCPLYHFTDARGLEGIFRCGAMWVTHYRYLNDPTEFKFGIDKISQFVQACESQFDGFGKLFCYKVGDLLSFERLSPHFQFFIASFCRQNDDLGLWRAYGANGSGYAIGFAPKVFTLAEQPLQGNFHQFILPVDYSRNDDEYCFSVIHKAAQTAEDAIGSCKDKATIEIFLDMLAKDLLARQLILQSLSYKHGAYSNEQEVRLIIGAHNEYFDKRIQTRTRMNEIVPFVSQPMPVLMPGTISEITLGPCTGELSENSLRLFLHSINIEHDILIRRSEIPYRAG